MKKIFILSILLVFTSATSQTKGLTDDGKEVVLFDDGTWKFVNESDKSILETMITNPKSYSKAKEASVLKRSKKLDVGLYYDPQEWTLLGSKITPAMEYMLSNKNDEQIMTFFIAEKIEIPNLKNLKDIIIANVQRNADYFRILESEYRTVNGLKVLYLRYAANAKGLDFEYIAYYYLEKEAYGGIVGFSLRNNFEKNQQKIETLLNGLALAKKDQNVELPPPPMQLKKAN